MNRDRVLWLAAAAGPLAWFVLLLAAFTLVAAREVAASRKHERAWFMATGALALSALSAAFVIASALPTLHEP